LIAILYLPSELAEQSEAALANDPDGSGNTYQFTTTAPLPDEPQAARAIAVTNIPKVAPMWRKTGFPPLSSPDPAGSDGHMVPPRP
jgi:hypothetical protein